LRDPLTLDTQVYPDETLAQAFTRLRRQGTPVKLGWTEQELLNRASEAWYALREAGPVETWRRPWSDFHLTIGQLIGAWSEASMTYADSEHARELDTLLADESLIGQPFRDAAAKVDHRRNARKSAIRRTLGLARPSRQAAA
jgi:hypothetical protein